MFYLANTHGLSPANCSRRGVHQRFSWQFDQFRQPSPRRLNELNPVCPRVRNPCLFGLLKRVDVSDADAEHNRARWNAKLGSAKQKCVAATVA
jgi:hypothetical protein